jgi:PAS domain S-box-containing protein
MSPEPGPPPGNAEKLAEMVRRLAEAEAALQATAAGQVDSVVLDDGSTYLLQQARQALNKSLEAQAQLAAIVESSADAIVGTTLGGIVTSWNRGAEEIYHFTADEMLGKPIARLIPPELQLEEIDVMARVAQGQSVGLYVTNRLRKDGSRIDVSVTASPIRNAAGVVAGAAKISRDITTWNQVTRKLEQSEFLLRVASRMTRMGGWSIEQPGTRVLWSDEVAAIYGEAPGTSPSVEEAINYYDPDHRSQIRAAFEACAGDGKAFDEELVLVTAQGRKVWVRAIGEAVRAPDGRVIRVQGTLQDIDERKAKDDALRASEQLFSNAFERAPIGIALVAPDGHFIKINGALCETVGYTAAELLKLTFKEITDPSDHEADLVTMRRMLAGEINSCQREKRYIHKRGHTVTVILNASLVRDAGGQPLYSIAQIQDVTERKKIEAQFLRAQRVESIGTLAGGIAHDLNNVLAPILMAIGLLKASARDKHELKVLDTIEASARRGADMVKQVLSFARGVEGHHMPTPPRHLIGDIRAVIEQTFPKSIQFRAEVADDIRPILGDPTQLHQVLLNLCVNARDAMPQGGRLTIKAENIALDEAYVKMNGEGRPGSYTIISVTDTGSGIPPEIRDKIFDPFFTTKEVGKGTGLGLATVMTIVRGHGGFIHLYSEPGRGTTFKLYFPAEDATQPDSAHPFAPELPRGHGEWVLVVDDEMAVRTITQQTLEAFGYRVLTADNGAEGVALYAVHVHEIAVVITDMMMPVMEGSALIHALLKLNPAVRIVAASGLGANGSVAKSAGPGVKHFLPKPYTAQILLETVHRVLREPPAPISGA